jgi:hypothetical protein
MSPVSISSHNFNSPVARYCNVERGVIIEKCLRKSHEVPKWISSVPFVKGMVKKSGE